MWNEGQKAAGTNGFIPSSFRAISGYLRIVSSGASTVATSVRSAAQSIAVDKGDSDARHDQVLWAGFDNLESERNFTRRVLLLGYRSGFQVWDVEDAHNVRDLVSKYDGPVSFLQMLPKPLSTTIHEDKFSGSRPLLVVYTDGSSLKDGKGAYRNGNISKIHDSDNGPYGPSTLRFYSLTSHSFVHVLKFRSTVYSVRCSSRVVAVSQAAQVHCFNAATLEREYTILTNPVVTTNPSSEGVGYGPLALGPRWLAYSGSPVDVSNANCVSPQQLNTSASFPNSISNGGRVALYAKESSNYLAAGIVTLGDKGYKKLSRYYSELRPGANNTDQSGALGGKVNGTINTHLPHIDSVGMVIVKDVVTKTVITQFRAHKSPISALCFDPSGTLLVTASAQGHNINVFRILPILPGTFSESDSNKSYIHLYRLQRGLTNAVRLLYLAFTLSYKKHEFAPPDGTSVLPYAHDLFEYSNLFEYGDIETPYHLIIQDITLSNDSRWVMISSSRGTNHLFAISPFGGTVDLHFADTSSDRNGTNFITDPALRWSSKPIGQTFSNKDLLSCGPPVTLSVVGRLRNGNNGWRGNINSSVSGAIAATFFVCEGNDMHVNLSSSKPRYYLLVFSPSGCLIKYALRVSPSLDNTTSLEVVSPSFESVPGNDSKLVVEATQKWNICQKRRERDDNCDIYGENGNLESNQIFGEKTKNLYGAYLGGKSAIASCPEERNHFYISEAELQMHESRTPLWAKSQICFHSIMFEIDKLEAEHDEGEIDIEKLSTRTIEARRRNLVPVFDNLDSPKSALVARNGAPDTKLEPHMFHQRPSFSQHGHLPNGGNARGLVTENGGELHFGMVESLDGIMKLANATMGSVYTNDSPKRKPELQIVNSRDRSYPKLEAGLKFVNTSQDLKTKNQAEDKAEEFE